MVVGRHTVHIAEHIVFATVVSYVGNYVKISSSDAVVNHTFAVAGGKSRTMRIENKGVFLHEITVVLG